MSTMIQLVAALTRLPKTLQKGATGWRGGVTVWPSKYDGGSETGSAAVQVVDDVFELYFPPKALVFADATEPQKAFKFSLAVNIEAGNPRFQVVGVEPKGKSALATEARLAIPNPVLVGVSNGALEVLVDAEAEQAMRVYAPKGMAFAPSLGDHAGSMLPAMEVRFERRLVPGTEQPPMRARAVNCDERLLVAAYPMVDLDSLVR